MSEAVVVDWSTAPMRPRAARRPEVAPHGWAPVALVKLGADPPEPPTIGPGLVYPDRVHVWSGEPESLKSLAALAVAAEEIRAGHCVLYLDHENGPRETLARLRALGLDDAEVEARLVYLAPSEPLTPERAVELAELVAVRRPTLVVVDSYTGSLALHGCDDHRGVEVERHTREVLRPLRASGAAVVLLDHVTKSRETRGRYSIGSERKVGAGEVHLGFEVVSPFGRGRRGVVQLHTHKDRPAYLTRPRAASLEFTSDRASGAIGFRILAASDPDEDGDGFRPTFLMERVSRWLEERGEPVSRNALDRARLGNHEYVRQAVGFLVLDGYASESKGARGAILTASVRPYRQGDPEPSTDLDLAPTSPESEQLDLAPTSPEPEPSSHAD